MGVKAVDDEFYHVCIQHFGQGHWVLRWEGLGWVGVVV